MTFEELNDKVLKAQAGNGRMTDIVSGIYTPLIEDKNIFLVSEKGQRVRVTENSLASMRIVTDATKAAEAKTTRDARSSETYSTLQAALAADKTKISEKTKFNVVHRLRIVDTATENLVYRNEHYKGYPAYLKSARVAAALTDATERQNAFAEASEALRQTGVKNGITEEDKNLVLMPVFTVTQ